MKLSILTATYNRGNLLGNLYKSIVDNLYDKLDIEWLIMDDGSTDNTEEVVGKFKNMEHLEIRYFKQENQGKMQAINNLMEYVSGELVMDCDSDDYFFENSLKNIYKTYLEYKDFEDIYALAFLKYDQNKKNMGKFFSEDKDLKTTMFDLHFKEEENGEKALVFISKIRKKYKYELENNEKFITETSLFYRMDEEYSIIGINIPVMLCEYKKDGYTNTSIKIFKENPCGYFKYFEYILKKDLHNIKFKKLMYVIKHYILFSYLSGKRINLRNVKNIKSKVLILILYVPGKIASFIKFKR